MLEIKKTSISKKQEIILIVLVSIAGLLIRLYFFPNNTPIATDAIDYFAYTVALSQGNIFPDVYVINKFGWPIFLAPFFALVDNPEMIDLMNIQRIISIFISILTLIPIYYLIRYFFNKEIGKLGGFPRFNTQQGSCAHACQAQKPAEESRGCCACSSPGKDQGRRAHASCPEFEA